MVEPFFPRALRLTILSFFLLLPLMACGSSEDEGGEGNSTFPAAWETPSPNVTGHNPFFLAVKQEANPRINGVPIEPGDWIGTFFLDNGVMKCAGADVWKSGGVIFNSYDDDLRTPDIKEGFSYGERVNVKIYSQKAKRDYDVTSMSFDLTDEAYVENRWYPLSLCVVIDMRADTGT